VFRWSIGLAMLEAVQKAQAGVLKISTKDAISPIEDIQIVDYPREKAVDIGRFRHEESQELLEGKHQHKVFMLNTTRGVATTLSDRIGSDSRNGNWPLFMRP